MDGIRDNRSWGLSRSYPCDPWLTGSESTKAFLPRIVSGWVSGWDSRQLVLGSNPDSIRVIRG